MPPSFNPLCLAAETLAVRLRSALPPRCACASWSFCSGFVLPFSTQIDSHGDLCLIPLARWWGRLRGRTPIPAAVGSEHPTTPAATPGVGLCSSSSAAFSKYTKHAKGYRCLQVLSSFLSPEQGWEADIMGIVCMLEQEGGCSASARHMLPVGMPGEGS